MANTVVTYREIRAVFEGKDGLGLLQVYILMESNDGTFGVDGWHHKTFAPDMSLDAVLKLWGEGKESPLLWPLNAPPRLS